MAPLTDSGSEFQNGRSIAESDSGTNGYVQPHMLGLVEVAGILRVQPERIQWLSQAYAESLSPTASKPIPQYTHDDLATLINAQRLEVEASEAVGNAAELATDKNTSNTRGPNPAQQQAGYVPSQFDEYRPSQNRTESADSADRVTPDDTEPAPTRLNDTDVQKNGSFKFARPAEYETPAPPSSSRSVGDESDTRLRSTPVESTSGPSATADLSAPAAHPSDEAKPAPLEIAVPRNTDVSANIGTDISADNVLGEMLSTVATSQQSVLSVQDSIREMLNVIAQDNFNLKHENRKLRERMLELERVIAEHQRREETRKEMLESRMRAVEGTLSALQQQLAQLVQLQRQRIRKNWFKQ